MAPQHVFVYADVAVNQLVPAGDDHASRNLRVVLSNRFRYVGGGFADEFDVAHCGVVAHCIGGKFCSARSLGERQNAFTKTNHVADKKTAIRAVMPLQTCSASRST